MSAIGPIIHYYQHLTGVHLILKFCAYISFVSSIWTIEILPQHSATVYETVLDALAIGCFGNLPVRIKLK